MITESKLRKAIHRENGLEPIFKLDGVLHEVKVDCIAIDKVEFTGKNFEGKVKSSRLTIADFCKIANFYELNEIEQEVVEMEEPIDGQNGTETTETGAGLMEASGLGETQGQSASVDLSPVSDAPSDITEDMLQIGYRFVLSDAVGEVEILKLNKKKVGYLSLTELSIDAKDRPEMVMVDKAEFLTQVNAYLDAKNNKAPETKEAPKIKVQKEVEAELTIKKSSDKLQVDLTPEEVLAYYEKLSGLLEEMGAKESEKAAYVSQIGGEIKELKAEINTLTGKVNSKKEFREVPVSIEYHWKKNKKLTIRQDTGAVVSETAIPKSELQNTFIDD